MKTDPNSTHDCLQFAVLLAQLSDEAGYRAHCHEFLARFANTTSAGSMEQTGKGCLLLPIGEADHAIALQLAHKAIATDPQSQLANYYRLVDGLAHARGGDFAKAIEVLTPLVGNPSPYFSSSAGALLALAQLRLGKTAEARATLARAEVLAAEKLPKPGTDLGGAWHDVLISRMLLKEARTALPVAIRPPVPKGADGWEDLLAPLAPAVVEKTGNGWRMDNGALFSPGKPYATLPLPGDLSGTSYQVRVKLRQLAPKNVFHVVLPVGDRMVGFDLDGFSGQYTGLVMVNGKFGKDLPGSLEGKQVKDSE